MGRHFGEWWGTGRTTRKWMTKWQVGKKTFSRNKELINGVMIKYVLNVAMKVKTRTLSRKTH
jgi:hypothetical protein